MLENRYFGRRVRVVFAEGITVIKNVDDEGLRVAFSVMRSNNPEPDMATIKVWNVRQDKRDRMIQLFGPGIIPTKIELFAGYTQLGIGGIDELLFTGDIIDIKDDNEMSLSPVLTITAGDGVSAFRDRTMHQGFVAGVPIDTVRKLTEASLGLGPGADSEATFKAALVGNRITTFKNGFVAGGKTSDILTEVSAAVGMKWWIKDGKIVYVRKTTVTNDIALKITPRTGLIGKPKTKGLGDIEFVSLLNPKLFPGRQVLVQTRRLDPTPKPFRADVCDYVGDTHGAEWFVKTLARRAEVI